MLPNRQTTWTNYLDWGDPTKQRIRTSSDTYFGGDREWNTSYIWFNGFGQVWKTAASGATQSASDDIVTRRRYDARGNLSYESIALSSDEEAGIGSADVPAGRRTTFLYDTLNRLILTTFADGNTEKVYYTARPFTALSGQRSLWPERDFWNADCFDADGTVGCGLSMLSYDAFGNVIRQAAQEYKDGKGYGGGSGTYRVTDYRFDDLDRLTTVKDPGGAQWSYSYDTYGNRTRASDPALGAWTMDYDVNGNLVRQRDAKRQTIAFTYDSLNRVTTKQVMTSADDLTETHYTYDQPRSGYFNTGQLTTERVRAGVETRYSDAVGWTPNGASGFWDSQRWLTGDFNGDGKDDLVAVYPHGGENDAVIQRVYLSNGSRFGNADTSWRSSAPFGFWDSQRWLTGDVDGDQKDDIIAIYGIFNNSEVQQRVYLSNGGQFSIPGFRKGTVTWGFWDSQRWLAGEFNGDGRADLVAVYNHNGKAYQRMYLAPRGGVPAPWRHIHELNYHVSGLPTSETHTIDGRSYELRQSYYLTGDIRRISLPYRPGQTVARWLDPFEYDAAGRMTAFGDYIDSVSYNPYGFRTATRYGNGARVQWAHNRLRGWLDAVDVLRADGRGSTA